MRLITKNQLIPGLLALSLFVFSAPSVRAAEITVPLDYSTIKEALFNAVHGDRVQLQPGTYYERDLQIPPGVTLVGMGESPREVIIDGGGLGRIMLCESLDTTTIIQNMTFTGGRAIGASSYDRSGGAILLNNSNPRIINCIFTGNIAEGHGGAIRCSHASPQIINCRFEGNMAPVGGGGALDCSYDSSPVIQSCEFKDNIALWGGALSCRGNASPSLYACLFESNIAQGDLGYGGAVMADHESHPVFQRTTFHTNQARYGGALACFKDSRPEFLECTLVANKSQWLGGGLICSESHPNIQNTIIAFQEGPAISCGSGALPMISCTNIFGNTRGDWSGTIAPQAQINGNLAVDPLFCEMPADSGATFHLETGSPCAPESTECGLMGAWEAGCDITPVYIVDFEAGWDLGLPIISWSFPREDESVKFLLKRSPSSAPEEQVIIPFRPVPGGTYEAIDETFPLTDGEIYTYLLFQIEEDGSHSLLATTQLTNDTPRAFDVKGAHPNPFNPSTTIGFFCERPRQVEATVHDLAGRRVRRLASGVFGSGDHHLQWDGRDGQGRRLESGTYFVMLRTEDHQEAVKVLLLK